MDVKVLLCCCLFISLSQAFPKKLLRVPKIYNALITTNEKLLPSEAYPGTTGPVFQPIGLTGEPILLNPEAFQRNNPQDGGAGGEGYDQENYEAPTNREQPRPFAPAEDSAQEKKMPTPITFYPRDVVYHQYSPFLPYTYPVQPVQPPLLYSYGNTFGPVVPNNPVQPVPQQRQANPRAIEQSPPEPQNTPQLPPQGPPPSPTSILPSNTGYVKNNQPQNKDIPDVPPPPPPVGAPSPDDRPDSESIDDDPR